MTTVNAEKIAKKIDELPPLPLVVQKLLNAVGNDFSSAKDIGATLSMDQALTSKVLKLVNSAFYGLPGKISTVTRAVVILGNAAVRNLALAFASFDALKKLRGPIDQEKFWDHALTCAVGAQALAPYFKYPEPEEAFIAGLLHDIGHLLLSTAFPEEYMETRKNISANYLEREEEILGITHTEAGTRLLEHWQIPEKLCRATRFHHSPKLASVTNEPLISLVILADILSIVRGCIFAGVVDESMLFQITKDAGLSMGEYGKVLAKMGEKIKEAKAFLQIAEHAELSRTPGTGDKEMASVVVISDDEQRILWIRGLLESFGYNVLVWNYDRESLFEWESTQLVILDLQGIPGTIIPTLDLLLRENDITGVVLTGNGDKASVEPAELAGYPILPFIFSRENIDKYLLKETAYDGQNINCRR